MSAEKNYERIEAPEYYETVREAVRNLVGCRGIVFNSGQDGNDEFKSLANGNQPTWPSDPEGREKLEVVFLDKKGAGVKDARLAIAALVIDSGPAATVYFKRHFNQPIDKTEAPSITSSPFDETVPQPPLMSNWQAEQIATNPAAYIDSMGMFRMG